VSISILTQIAPEKRLLERLKPAAEKAEKAFIAVSFIQKTGFKHLFASIKGILEKTGNVTIYTSGYLRVTEPQALEDLLRLTRNYPSLNVFFNPYDRFHSKFLLFEKPKRTYTLFLGSSNISVGGLLELGELNAEISGKTSDEVYKDVQIVIGNLKKEKSFEKINKDLIDEYKEEYKKRKRNGKRGGKVRIVPIRPLGTMPVCLIERWFNKKEKKKILLIHPKWEYFITMVPDLKQLNRGDHYLEVTNINGKKTFNVGQFIEYDRNIPGVGKVAHVKYGKILPLKKLAMKLGISENKLLQKKKLDIYDIAILHKHFKGTFA
jgi:HKD family nuclease